MTPPNELEQFHLRATVEGATVEISGLWRDGTGPALVFLHGFGCTKEDYADVIQQRDLADRPVLAYDAPGCGASACSDPDAVSIPFLVAVAAEVLRAKQIRSHHLIGHSMGGVTALLLAHADPSRVVSFVNIEGDLAPEDCFLSRQIVSHPHPDPQDFLREFAQRIATSRHYSSALYASALPHKVRPEVVRPIFESMVALSDHGDLMKKFLALPLPRQIMYGEQNSSLSYLDELATAGVELAEIPHSAHFPMYSNASEMWSRITDFVLRSEQELR